MRGQVGAQVRAAVVAVADDLAGGAAQALGTFGEHLFDRLTVVGVARGDLDVGDQFRFELFGHVHFVAVEERRG